MKVLVTGSRYWTNRNAIEDELDALMVAHHGIVVIHGGARGADSLAKEICDQNKIESIEYPAQWELFGKSAGIRRNIQMFDEEKPDLVLAFHEDLFGKSKGTLHMVQYALQNRTPVTIIPEF